MSGKCPVQRYAKTGVLILVVLRSSDMMLNALILVVAALPPVGSADSVRGDTLQFRTVTVEADRWLNDVSGAGMPTTLLDERLMQRLAPQTLPEVLPLLPGVFVRDYGGVGGLKTVSLRGGSSAQSLVVLDGARLSSAQNGTFDISLLPARFVRELRLIRGGVSALYGANAITGVLDVTLGVPLAPSLRAFAGGGSFDEWRLGIGGATSFDDVRIGVDVDAFGSAGSFPFLTDQYGSTYEINRSNGDVRSTSAVARIEAGRVATLTLIGRTSDRGVPGAVVQGAVTNARARLADDDIVGILTSTLLQTGSGTLTLTGTGRALDERYEDPDATITGPEGIDVRFTQRDATVGLRYAGTLGTVLHTTQLDAAYADLRGDRIVTDSGGFVLRRSVGARTDVQWQGAFSMPITMRGAVRVDGFSDMGWAVSPLVAVQYEPDDDVTLRASWSYNFRPPSFNELYFLNYGTRSLRPERSQTLDAGVSVRPISWLHVDADVFWTSTRDLIVSVPVSPVVTSAQNVGSARSMGIELLARGAWFDGRLVAQWTYALQDVRDVTGRAGLDGTMIPYTVPEATSALVQWDDDLLTASVQWSYTSYRYAQPGGEYTSLLQPFNLVSAQVGVHAGGAHSRVDVRLRCDNLFDERYVIVRGYPMPGRVVRLSTSIEVGP